MANIVDLLIGLGIDAESYESGLAAADQHSTNFIDRMTGPLTSAVVGAFAIGGAAVAGFAVSSVSHFADFQASMNEVFTLLPGISQDAMHDMTDQVKTFSKDFGVLPEKVVPALYQSLSAGVPPDNVFKFLESANKAATAGVTDLSVAVDGISSVVNAYGSDVIDATKASDLMFTAVKLGKTNFEQLSSSLFNVTPAAAAAGVKFETVTAALAAMTLQGVPTSVATTKLRAAINELSQAGTKTDKIFRDVAGKSFKEFIASGGSMQGALQLLEQHAKDTNVGINDLFGSVDAGSAALLLTGKGTEAFSNALAGMETSAGATDTAFATMNTGITDAIDDMKAAFSVFMLDVGERLAPFAQLIADTLGAALPVLADAILGVIDPITTFANTIISAEDPIFALVDALIPISPTLATIVAAISDLITTGGDLGVVFDDLAEGFGPEIAGPIVALIKLIGDNLQPILLAVATVIGVVVVGAIASFIAGIVAAAAPIVATIAVIAALYAAFQSNFLGIRDVVTNIMFAVQGVISTVVAFITDFWRRNGADIVATVTEHFNTIQQTISDVLQIIDTIITAVMTGITSFMDRHGAQIDAILDNAWIIIKNIIGAAITLISGLIHAFLQVLQGDWSGAWLTIKNTAASFVTQIFTALKAGFDNIRITLTIIWEEIYTAISSVLNRITNWVILTLISIVDNVRNFAEKAASAAAEVGNGIVNGITKAIENGVNAIIDAAKNAAMSALNAAKSALGISSPSRAFETQVGEPIVAGIITGVGNMTGALVNTLNTSLAPVAGIVNTNVAVPIDTTLANAQKSVEKYGDTIPQALLDRIDDNLKPLRKIADTNVLGVIDTSLDKAGDNAADQANVIGTSIADGIVDGLRSGTGAINAAAKSAAREALGAAKDELGISSPSKRAITEVGKPFAQGIIVGVDRMSRQVASAGARAGDILANGTSATAPAFSGTASSASAVGVGAAAGGIQQVYNIDAHYSKYQDERTLRDTIRMESALNAPVAG